MLKKFQDYIENGPWEDNLKKNDDHILTPIAWVIIVIAALYFAPSCIDILLFLWGQN